MPNRCVAICPNIASNDRKRETIPIQHCCELPDSGYSVTVKSTLFLEKPMLQSCRLTGISCLLLICWHLLASSSYAQTLTRLEPTTFDSMEYRHIGPVGNRVSAVVGVPGDRNIYYAGAASGGIFKSIDGGIHWEPIFDDQPVASIGALAINPVNPNIVWAGTGETFIRSNISHGNGIYRSTDAGKTWQHMGLDATGRIGRIVVHPTNPDIVFAAALGHGYGPQEDRGIFRSQDNGLTWEHVLFVDEHTGASDLAIDPNNPQILFAGMWQLFIQTWGRESGGPGSGLWTSRDGGSTWHELTGNGLPSKPLGKIGLSMTPIDSNRIYALIETNADANVEDHEGVLWRSDDGGDQWQMVNADHTLAQRPLYYTRATVAPDDRDEIHFLSTRHSVSLDGGLTITRGTAGGDNHDMWIDPLIPDRMIVGHDGGLSISTTRGESWWRPRMPIAQMYHAYTDNQIPYYVYGNRQDGPSARVPSNSLQQGGIPIGLMHSVGGCESGFAIPDPVENNIVWSGCYDSILERYDLNTGHARNVSVWPDNPEGWAAADVPYRFQWTFPIAISPHDHNRVYVGSQYVHVTMNGGHSWNIISPDLTTNDKSKQQKTGGLTPEDVSPTYAAVLFALAESPLAEGVLWSGSNDGLVHITRDGGDTWTNVTNNLPELPPWGTISNIEASSHDPSTAYLSVDLHQIGNFDPFIYVTTDYGNTWSKISDTIPTSPLSFVHVVREDPIQPGLLYAGTENALYVSFNNGAQWHSLQSNLPHVPVHWLTIQPHFNDLVVGTYGRGFWILDDITPLQRWTEASGTTNAHLFTPRPAYRFRTRKSVMSQPEDSGSGTNPTYGASLHYYLGADFSDAEEVTLTIHNAAGDSVRSLKNLSTTAGLHRVFWDLRYAQTTQPRIRMPAIGHSHVRPDPETETRPIGDGSRVALLAPPGDYTVKLVVGDTTLTEPLRVLKDPNSAGSEADIAKQMILLFEIRDALSEGVSLINEIELIREQLDAQDGWLDNHQEADAIQEQAHALDERLIALEMNLSDLRLSGGSARQDSIRWPRQLLAKLSSLASYVGQTDFEPTTQQRAVFENYEELLNTYQLRMTDILNGDVAELNRNLEALGLGGILHPEPDQ